MTTDEVTDSDSPCVSRRSEDGREGARRGDDQGEVRGRSEGEVHDGKPGPGPGLG